MKETGHPDTEKRTPKEMPSILVVDDEPAILASLTSLLRRQRLSVHAFESGEAALEFARTNPLSLILSDMKMPHITGTEVLQQAARVNPDAVRILMSGHESKEDILAAINNGIAQFYIFKPWEDDALRETITAAVRLQRELKALRLKEVVKSFGTLPSPSRFQTGLWELLAKPEKPIHELAEEIERSPALVARLLRVANSVFFGSRQKVNAVMDAIRLVGTQYVVSLAISVETMNSLNRGLSPEVSAAVERVWDRSVQKTNLAKQIGARWNNFHHMQALTIASLLQDIGTIVLICYRTGEYKRYQQSLTQAGANAYALQQEIFGITHEKLGEAVLEYWNFPKEISHAVGRHHGPTENDTIAIILQLANILNDENDARPYDQSIVGLLGEWSQLIGT